METIINYFENGVHFFSSLKADIKREAKTNPCFQSFYEVLTDLFRNKLHIDFTDPNLYTSLFLQKVDREKGKLTFVLYTKEGLDQYAYNFFILFNKKEKKFSLENMVTLSINRYHYAIKAASNCYRDYQFSEKFFFNFGKGIIDCNILRYSIPNMYESKIIKENEFENIEKMFSNADKEIDSNLLLCLDDLTLDKLILGESKREWASFFMVERHLQSSTHKIVVERCYKKDVNGIMSLLSETFSKEKLDEYY